VVGVTAMFLVAGYLMLRGFGFFGEPARATVRDVPAGCQEIAWIAPATSGEAWERLVAAVQLLKEEWPTVHAGQPALQLSLDKAFLDLSADVPEISLSFAGNEDARLLLRWYKLSSEIGTHKWVDNLAKRATPPLAILGGETSDRALAMAHALRDRAGQWPGPDPLFLITTATADNYVPSHLRNVDITTDNWPKLVEVYKGQTFRFAFNNTRVAEAVLEFLRQHAEVWPPQPPAREALTGLIAATEPFSRLGWAAASVRDDYFLYYIAWSDDRYSVDLAERFRKVFQDLFPAHGSNPAQANYLNNWVNYSVGDFIQPNPREELAVDLFLIDNSRFREQRQILALPTGSQRVGRFLRTLCRRAPQDLRNIVAISGDSITFNTIYRDRDLAWNVMDMPVPLVFFSHRNPIDPHAGFGAKQRDHCRIATTGTQDLLFYRDIAEALVQAAFQPGPDGLLLLDGKKVGKRLAHARWFQGRVHRPKLNPAAATGLPLFDADGNRTPGTGEHVVWLKPTFEGTRVLPQAFISVYFAEQQHGATRWQRFGAPLTVQYGRSRAEEFSANAAN